MVQVGPGDKVYFSKSNTETASSNEKEKNLANRNYKACFFLGGDHVL